MALSCGFFNAANHDRKYDAVQISQLFDGLIADGVFATIGKALVVKASTTNAREVIVQPGRAWFNHTWTLNDADLPIAAPDPGVILDRIDALVLDVNSDVSVRNNTIIWVQGEESAQEPQKPTLINTDTHHQHPLCFVVRRAGVYEITQADIENAVGTSSCPFVSGIIDTIDITDLLARWDSSMSTYMDNTGTKFEEWWNALRIIMDGDVAGHLQNEIDALDDRLTANDEKIYLDYHDGRYGINTDPERGADTFIPFKRPAEDIYTFPVNDIGSQKDLGEDHTYRYVDATNVYAKGVADGTGSENPKITYTYHHHTIDSTNRDSTDKTPGPYSDTYGAVSSGGCFTNPQTVRVGTDSGTRRVTVELNTVSDPDGSVYKRCPKCGGTEGGGTYDHVYHTHTESYSNPIYGTRYFCTCGKKECQRLKAVIDFT